MEGAHLSDRAAWLARWILPHEPALRRLLGRMRLPDGLLAEDVIQEAYARLVTLESVSEVRSPKSYFFQTARSVVLAHVRRSRITSIVVADGLAHLDAAAAEDTPEERVSDRERLQQLATAIGALSEPMRTAFMLRMLHELSYRDIGARIGASENAVQKMVARSVILLKSKLGPGGFQAQPDSKLHDAAAIRSRHGDAPDQ